MELIAAPGTEPVARFTVCRDPVGRFSVVMETLDAVGGTTATTLGLAHDTMKAALSEAAELCSAAERIVTWVRG